MPETSAPPRLLDVRQVAALLDCSTRHVHRLVKSRRMPRPLNIGALCRWPEAVVAEWIAQGCPAVEAEEVSSAN